MSQPGVRAVATAERGHPAGHRWVGLIVVLTGQFMASLDTTIGNLAAPSIGADLAASPAEVRLAVAAYTLFYASVLITGARLGADRGRRPVYLVGIAVFTLASCAAGAAPTGTVLIVARAVQGLGAALAIPQIISFIQIGFTGAARNRALASYGTMVSFGASMGLTAGGWLIDLDIAGLGWRSVFLINLPVGVVTVALSAWALPRVPPSPRRFDIAGMTLLAIGGLLVTGPLTLASDEGWPASHLIALGIGAILLVGFAGQQIRLRRMDGAPLLDPAIFTTAGVRPGLAALLCSNVTYTGVLYCVAAYLQDTRADPPLVAGLSLLPFAVGFGVSAAISSLIPPERHRALIAIGIGLLAAGLLLLATVTIRHQWPGVVAELLLVTVGFGYGCTFSPLIGRTVANVRGTNVPDASGIATTTFQFAFVLGVGAFGGLYGLTGLPVALTAMAGSALTALIPLAMPTRTPPRPA